MSLFFEKLVGICHDLLYRDKQLFDYLKNRNISASTISKYKLGAFPKDLRILFDRMHPEELMDNGIIWNAYESPFKYGDNNKIYYPIVVPIQDMENNFVAIGCRTLLSDEERKLVGIPKYKNTEYKKTSFLYGLNYAIEAIRKHDIVFVVEGQFDVISCHQAGVHNVVGTCGTIFSKRQLIILSRYTNNIVLLFDNDVPGHNSATRVKQKMEDEKRISANLVCRFTPEGYKDIDEYLCRGGNLKFFSDIHTT
jgi:DNA primase